jgi:phage shock protein PspC (stress-responsive transcriptional regulator)
MKKNISINIGGIIFHIEEDGYEHLKQYLESINLYFASFDDNHEIIADIESRIAEIFLSKLNEGKQVITLADIEALITTMGSVKDFQSIEEPEEPVHNSTNSEQTESTSTGGRKFYRDSNRKILGGVSSGLAHYFKIDPLWMRLLFIILITSTGVLLLAYIIMWIVVPESDQLVEDKNLKKLYRNPEGRVLGGIAGGIAAYFGVEVAYIRLFWILSILFFGTGLLLYIILWLILPEAKSITEKVQMQGEPVTLSNIESNIKQGLDVDENKDESIFVKIILFPFRLISIIITGIGRALGPILLFIVEAFRVFFGLVMTLTGLSVLLSLVVSTGILLGIFTTGTFLGIDGLYLDFPIFLIKEGLSVFSIFAAFFAAAIPAFFVIVLGASIVAKTKILRANVGWSLLAVWFISILGLSFTIPSIIFNFREDGVHKETDSYDLKGKTAVLTVNEIGYESYEVTSLQLRGHEGDAYKLVKEFESRGRTRREAIENAKMVDYNMTLEDSVFLFDSNITFDEYAKFRGQDLNMIMYIPYNQPFKMSYSLREIIRNTIYRSGYDIYDMDMENTWIFTPAGLECITCEKSLSQYEERNSHRNSNSTSRIYEFEDFTSLEIGSAFEVDVRQGDAYKVILYGSEEQIDDIRLMKDGDLLDIRYNKETYDFSKRTRKNIKVKIIMPDITDINTSGASKAYINGFKAEKVTLNLSGASYIEVDGDFDDVEAIVKGASELELKGSGKELRAKITGASKVNAYSYMVNFATVEATGYASAQLYVTERLAVESSVVSNVKYKGGAELISTISEDD